MFKLTTERRFRHTVKVQVPADDGQAEESFRAVFRVVPVETVSAFDLATEKGAREFLTSAIVSLEDIADGAGNPLDYSEAIRDRLLDLPYVRAALAETYFSAVGGQRGKN